MNENKILIRLWNVNLKVGGELEDLIFVGWMMLWKTSGYLMLETGRWKPRRKILREAEARSEL